MGALTGRTALVTGSSRGIGFDIAKALIAAGARVIMHGVSPAGAAAAESLGASFITADLADPAALERLADTVIAGGALDILVNNAAIEEHQAIADLDPATLARGMQVNLYAPIRLVTRFMPLLQASGHGSVLNISSIHETVPVFGNVAYCASKAALAMFTKTAAVELAERGIRVNAIAPGAIATDMNRDLIAAMGPGTFDEWIPAGRVGEVAEISAAAVFLVSDVSSYTTGATLTIDGGYTQNLLRYRNA